MWLEASMGEIHLYNPSYHSPLLTSNHIKGSEIPRLDLVIRIIISISLGHQYKMLLVRILLYVLVLIHACANQLFLIHASALL